MQSRLLAFRRVRQRAFRAFEVVLGVPARYNASERQLRPGPTQTRLGVWWSQHPRVVKALTVLAMAWSAAYLTWRWGWSWDGASMWVWGPLLVAETFGVWSLLTLAFFGWSRPDPERRPVVEGCSVDVYVCTYDEGVDVVRTTLAGCQAMAYPHTTYLLDDGRRAEMAQLAAEMGAIWLTRPDNSHAKAGNINHALGQTTGEFVFILDADHVPLPDALDSVIGYTADPLVAVVQTPHDFYNQDSAQHYAVGRHEQSIFYDVICPGKDRHGAAFWCGSATLVRREALLEVGGVAVETIAEDFHTTIKMQRRGWQTRYHNEVVVQGLAPHDLAGYLLQRDRWARGNLAVFTTMESPLRAAELSAKQRFSYFASLASYTAGPVRALTLLVLAATLWTGLLPMRAALPALLALWLPAVALQLTAASALSRGYMRIADSTHFELCTSEIYLRALRCIVRPGKTKFKVTPKEGVDLGGLHSVRQLKLVSALAVLLTAGLALRLVDATIADVLPDLPGIAAWAVPAIAAVELRRVARTLVLVGRRRQRRNEYRFPCDESADLVRLDRVWSTDLGSTVSVVDISTRGAGLQSDDRLEPGEPVALALHLACADGNMREVVVEAEVRLCRPSGAGWRIGVTFRSVPAHAMRHLVEFCYIVCPFERLRGHRPRAVVRAESPAATPPPCQLPPPPVLEPSEISVPGLRRV